MMPRNNRHGNASLASGPSHARGQRRQNVVSNAGSDDSLNVTSASQDKRVETPAAGLESAGDSSPREYPNATTLPERRKDKPPSQVPCRYFRSGYCARGKACKFKHDVEQLKLQNFQLKTVLRSLEEARQCEEAPKGDYFLPNSYMLAGHGDKALALWRAEYWENKTAQARAYQIQAAKAKEEGPSERANVHMDVMRLQDKVDPIGESARKVAKANKERKTVFVKGDPDDPGAPIPPEAECCPICQDDPAEIKVFGLLKNCNHIFCYDCITDWRKANATNKTCPVCRVRSPFVFRSSVYPYTPGGKVDDSSKPIESPKAPQEPSRLDAGKLPVEDIDGIRNGKTGPLNPDATSPDITGTKGRFSLGARVHTSGIMDGNGNASMLSGDRGVTNFVDYRITSYEANSTHTKLMSPGKPRVEGDSAGVQNSNGEPIKKKRTRRKPVESTDPNPAKTVLLNNYLKKMKTIPCKFFCDPKHAKTVTLDRNCNETQSRSWGSQSVERNDWSRGQRKIPYCKFGNDCHYSHPNPEKPDEEYKYDDWERRALDLNRRKKRNPREANLHIEDEDEIVIWTIASADSDWPITIPITHLTNWF